MLIDFCGFTFNGIHSSELNIIRVSNGSRYSENLGSSFQDKTAQVDGGDGILFWNSFYSNKPFSIQIAFDGLTEVQLRRLRQVFCAKAIGELIFDETPYKAYTAKVQTPVQINYVCFDDKNGARVYKGEGSIQFIAYYPYAKSVHKYLDEFDDFYYNNKQQWAESSGMLTTRGTYDVGSVFVVFYNPGDIETDWQAFFNFEYLASSGLQVQLDNGNRGILNFLPITTTKDVNDTYLRINSRTQLIEGCNSNKKTTGTLYNEYLSSGDFFKIPLGESVFSCTVPCNEVKYTYLYY